MEIREQLSECCGSKADSQNLCGECHEPTAFLELNSVEWLDGSQSGVDRGLIVGTFAVAA